MVCYWPKELLIWHCTVLSSSYIVVQLIMIILSLTALYSACDHVCQNPSFWGHFCLKACYLVVLFVGYHWHYMLCRYQISVTPFTKWLSRNHWLILQMIKLHKCVPIWENHTLAYSVYNNFDEMLTIQH